MKPVTVGREERGGGGGVQTCEQLRVVAVVTVEGAGALDVDWQAHCSLQRVDAVNLGHEQLLATERGEGGGADTDSGGSLSGGEFRGGAVIESATVEDGERSRVSRGHRMGKKSARGGVVRWNSRRVR